ncbi:MAG: AraC family transcriptional regulator [Lachnospiraceae bacterium]|nr:AraC family transcriptional regulator [Lachnospiraceae bacterium]
MLEGLEIFYKMLLDCYGIWSWEYDQDRKLLYTNSLQQYFHGLLLFGRNRDQIIREHGNRNDAPLIISNSIGTMWAVVFLKGEDGKAEKYFAIGPVFSGETSKHNHEQLVEHLHLSLKNKWALLDCMEHIPYVATTAFFQHVIALHYYVTGNKARNSDFTYYMTKEEEAVKQEREWQQQPHAPLINEKKLLDMVRKGNLDYHNVLADAGITSPGIRMRSGNPIHQAKYSVVAFITLCTRAAMEGGLSSECAYALNDTYTEAVDNARTISDIAMISHTMYEDFIRRVNRIRRENGISRPVRLCCDYIDNHVEEELELRKIAGRVGYTDYYLARKFKAEMGMSVNAYIRQERVRHSKQLLTATALTIEEIGARLHFCSRSYYAKAFRESEGITPGEYRERYRGSHEG